MNYENNIIKIHINLTTQNLPTQLGLDCVKEMTDSIMDMAYKKYPSKKIEIIINTK